MTGGRTTIESAISVDGTKRWKLIRRQDGFFVYFEDTFVTEDLREFGGGMIEGWTPTHFSGLFDTAEAAKSDALGELPWPKSDVPAGIERPFPPQPPSR